MIHKSLVIMAAFVLACSTRASAATLYAASDGSSSGSCTGAWASACTLARALDVSSEGDEIWVKAGTYPPISLVNGVRLIGGFVGTETAASQSDPSTNTTTINGGGSRAVTSVNHSPLTMLRGFRVVNGRDDGYAWGGGGMLLQDSSALIVQTEFQGNTGAFWGGAASIVGNSSPHFVNCKFIGNGEMTIGSEEVRTVAGGAVFLQQGSPKFTNCLFAGNKAGDGGALANNGGSVSFYNCTIVGNQATVGIGGGVADPDGTVELRNSILWNNSAVRGGDQIYNEPDKVSVVRYTDVQGSFSGDSVLNSDPLFAQGYKLGNDSPCKNAGSNGYIPSTDVADLDWDTVTNEALPKDLDMKTRKVLLVVDMGCFETPASGGAN